MYRDDIFITGGRRSNRTDGQKVEYNIDKLSVKCEESSGGEQDASMVRLCKGLCVSVGRRVGVVCS